MTMSDLRLRDIYRYGSKHDADVGLEIEVEYTMPRDPHKNRYWDTKADGSLRYYGYEYVNNKPIQLEAVPTALKHVIPYIKEGKPILDSPRTSIHVHKNVQTKTPLQVWTAACRYWLLEHLLFQVCGPDRQGNLFCLQLSDAGGMVELCSQDIREKMPFNILKNEHYRYGGINLASVSRLGSVEFRGMAGIYDEDHINMWAKGLSRLVDYNEHKNPEEMFDAYLEGNKKEFIERCVGPELSSKLFEVKNWKDHAEAQILDVAEIAYMIDWNVWSKKINTHNAKKPKPEGVAEGLNLPEGWQAAGNIINPVFQVRQADVVIMDEEAEMARIHPDDGV